MGQNKKELLLGQIDKINEVISTPRKTSRKKTLLIIKKNGFQTKNKRRIYILPFKHSKVIPKNR